MTTTKTLVDHLDDKRDLLIPEVYTKVREMLQTTGKSISIGTCTAKSAEQLDSHTNNSYVTYSDQQGYRLRFRQPCFNGLCDEIKYDQPDHTTSEPLTNYWLWFSPMSFPDIFPDFHAHVIRTMFKSGVTKEDVSAFFKKVGVVITPEVTSKWFVGYLISTLIASRSCTSRDQVGFYSGNLFCWSLASFIYNAHTKENFEGGITNETYRNGPPMTQLMDYSYYVYPVLLAFNTQFGPLLAEEPNRPGDIQFNNISPKSWQNLPLTSKVTTIINQQSEEM